MKLDFRRAFQHLVNVALIPALIVIIINCIKRLKGQRQFAQVRT